MTVDGQDIPLEQSRFRFGILAQTFADLGGLSQSNEIKAESNAALLFSQPMSEGRTGTDGVVDSNAFTVELISRHLRHQGLFL